MCKKPDGSIFPVLLYMQPFTSDGFNFDVFVSILPSSNSNDMVIVSDSFTGKVLGMTNPCRRLFPAIFEEVAANSVFIDGLIEDFVENREAWTGIEEPAEASLASRRAMDDSGAIKVSIKTTTILENSVDMVTVLDCSGWAQPELDHYHHSIEDNDSDQFDSDEADLTSIDRDSVSIAGDSEADDELEKSRSSRRDLGSLMLPKVTSSEACHS